jgi:hypothetical protein
VREMGDHVHLLADGLERGTDLLLERREHRGQLGPCGGGLDGCRCRTRAPRGRCAGRACGTARAASAGRASGPRGLHPWRRATTYADFHRWRASRALPMTPMRVRTFRRRHRAAESPLSSTRAARESPARVRCDRRLLGECSVAASTAACRSGDLAGRLESRVPRTAGKTACTSSTSGTGRHAHGRLGDDAHASFRPQHHLAQVRSGGGCGERRQLEGSGGRLHHATAKSRSMRP